MKRIVVLISIILALTFTACHQGAVMKVSGKSVPSSKTVNDVEKRVFPENLNPSKVYYTGKAVVLTYHHISTKPFSAITIKPQRFEDDLKMIRDKGFNVISLRQLLNAMSGNGKLPPNALVITFDDGIESFYKYAYPMLKKYDMPATEFVITARNKGYKPSNAELNPLSPAEIKEMYDSGYVDIQSHTNNSHDYGYINADLKKAAMLSYRLYDPATKKYETEAQYTDRITKDLSTSRDLIHDFTGTYPDMLCFPFGSYTRKVIDVSRQVGFKYFITTAAGVNRQDSNSKFILRYEAGVSRINSQKVFDNILAISKGIIPNNFKKSTKSELPQQKGSDTQGKTTTTAPAPATTSQL